MILLFKGHLTGKYDHHRTLSSCPLYHNMSAEECKVEFSFIITICIFHNNYYFIKKRLMDREANMDKKDSITSEKRDLRNKVIT